jgi:hypothetical protein
MKGKAKKTVQLKAIGNFMRQCIMRYDKTLAHQLKNLTREAQHGKRRKPTLATTGS